MASLPISHPKAQRARAASRPRSALSESNTSSVEAKATKGFETLVAEKDEVRREKRQGSEVLQQQDRELATLQASLDAREPSRDTAAREYLQRREKAKAQKECTDLETMLIQKLLARTPNGQLPSAARNLLLRTFKHMDRDNDGTATFDEFLLVAAKIGMCTQLRPGLPAEEERRLRALYDKNDDSKCGFLNYSAFCNALKAHPLMQSEAPPPTLPGRTGDALRDANPALARRQLLHAAAAEHVEVQVVLPRSDEMGAALRGRLRDGPEGRQLAQEAQEALLQQAPAQRRAVREELDKQMRAARLAEEEQRREQQLDARRRHAAAEAARVEEGKKARREEEEEKRRARQERVRLQRHEAAQREEQTAAQREAEARMKRQWAERVRREGEAEAQQRREQREQRQAYEARMQAARPQAPPPAGWARGYQPKGSAIKGWSASHVARGGTR